MTAQQTHGTHGTGAGDMGQCLWEKQSSSEARAEASVTNVASLHEDECRRLEASQCGVYMDRPQSRWTDRQTAW